jgi:hypothetical protein
MYAHVRLQDLQRNVVLSIAEFGCGKAATNAISEWHFGQSTLNEPLSIYFRISASGYAPFKMTASATAKLIQIAINRITMARNASAASPMNRRLALKANEFVLISPVECLRFCGTLDRKGLEQG